MNIENSPIGKASILLLGFTENFGDFIPPLPAHGGTYRLEFTATSFINNVPVEGSEEWRAFLPNRDLTTIRHFKTLGELNFFHKGMCGKFLFPPTNLDLP